MTNCFKIMIFIYSPHITPRLEYVVEHLFENVLGVEFVLSSDRKAFFGHSGTCINYSTNSMGRGIWIKPHGLLEKRGVMGPLSFEEGQWEDLYCFFANDGYQVPFDIFSASFYLLTLYEEYMSKDLDDHGRFDAKTSLAFRKNFLETPLVDRWAYKLKDIMIRRYGEAESYVPRPYRFISTFDIDHPYQYRNKGVLKTIVCLLRDLARGKRNDFFERLRVVFRIQEDPFMSALYWIDSFHQKYKKNFYLFVLLSKNSKYGSKIIYPPRGYFRYLRSLLNAQIGLHSSYESFLNKRKVSKEKRQLEQVTGKKVTVNRQHFLKLQTPGTFRILSELRFSEDFSLAYSRHPGFRSGTSIPHRFYNVEFDSVARMWIHPTVVMDTSLMIHLKLTPEEALKKMQDLAGECKRVGGDFVMIWHNNNLAGHPAKNPWIKIFIQSFEYAISLENGNFGAENKINLN